MNRPFRSAIEKGGVKFEVECDYKDPRQVYVDPGEFFGPFFFKRRWDLTQHPWDNRLVREDCV